MKKCFLIALFIIVPFVSNAQITHSYRFPNEPVTRYSFEQVEDTAFRIISVIGNYSQIKIYNHDNTLDRDIFINSDHQTNTSFVDNVLLVTKSLFDTNDMYEYVQKGRIHGAIDTPWIAIYNENQDLLFSCKSCEFATSLGGYGFTISDLSGAFRVVNDTARMLIRNVFDGSTDIYNLPGRLPQCKTNVIGGDETTIISGVVLPLKAYPNPSDGKIRVSYTLPEGVSSGELVITSTDGREVKRYRVGNMFNDILIEKSELPSGAYFYKLITERGESEARKFVITN